MTTLIVDSCPLFRRGLQHALANTKFRSRLTAGKLDELSDEVIQKDATLAILGCDRDSKTGFCDLQKILELKPSMPIALLSDSVAPGTVQEAIAAGARAVLSRNISGEALVGYLSLIALGETVMPLSIAIPAPERREREIALPTNTFSEPLGPNVDPEFRSRVGRLSGRELAILQELLNGASNKIIARLLQISEATVKVHIKAMFRKIGVKNRTQAAMWASRQLLK